MKKLIGTLGFVLVLIGIACADSPSLLIPIAFIIAGAALIAATAGMESKWAKE